ncbi:MAG: N-formylglutamate amidohydrolase [Pseudomonadota bacterium]|nr:N-formylglutamate amidohydrolase [Pseudomonadota bacterium]
MSNMTLLGPADAAPFRIINKAGRSSFLLLGDHAGNAIPAKLAWLGLGEGDLTRHIAWDIGVSALGTRLAQSLDACFIEQRYSRLVVDCNRHAAAPDAMAARSDGTVVPANVDLAPADRAARLAEIYEPYHRAIADTLAERLIARRPTVLVALHSFTPSLAGGALRPWDIGVLHDGRNDGFARALLALLTATPGLCVGDNQPYQMNGTDYTVPRHAWPALPYVEVEVNQRRLADDPGIMEMASVLTKMLTEAAIA